jgi:peptide/nickel transport system substrate-binding protein
MYWGSKPAYSTIVIRNVPAATQRLDIQDGQTQLALDISPADTTGLSSSLTVITAPTSDETELLMNANPRVSTLTANQDFRDAVKYGLDYKGLVALAGKGALRATGFVPVGVLGALPASDAPQTDLTRARAALAKVGVSNPTVELGYSSDFVTDGLGPAIFATKIQSDLNAIGITVKLVPALQSVALPKLMAGQEQMFFIPWLTDYPDPSDFNGFTVGPDGYLSTWMNLVPSVEPALAALSATAISAVQPADRSAAYQALARAMNAKGYSLFLAQPSRALVKAKSVDASFNPFTFVDFG